MSDAEPETSRPASNRKAMAEWSLIILGILAVLSALAYARVLIVPVLLALLLAMVFSPLCRWLANRGFPQGLSAALIVLLLLTGTVAAAVSLAVPVANWIEDAPRITREVERKLRDITGLAESVMRATEQVEQATKSSSSDDGPVEVVVREPGAISVIAFGAPIFAGQTAFVLILLFFILASGTLFHERLVRVMPTFADKKRAIAIAYDIERELSRYLLSITAINAGLGVAVGVAFTLLGMPSPLLFGIMAFALNYVPFIGALVGTGLAFAVALVSLPTATDALFVAAVFWGLTAIEGQFVTPMLVGRQLQLNTVVILIAVAFWAWLWSIMGMLMAVPLLVTLRIFCRHIPEFSTLEAFLSARDSERDR